jgi:hypothetical protein
MRVVEWTFSNVICMTDVLISLNKFLLFFNPKQLSKSSQCLLITDSSQLNDCTENDAIGLASFEPIYIFISHFQSTHCNFYSFHDEEVSVSIPKLLGA